VIGEYVNGDEVQIISGPLKGQVGLIGGTRVSDGKVEVILKDAASTSFSGQEPDEFHSEDELARVVYHDGE
jgi:ribosomal protein L24